jgi:tetratricopeptide (TPR) repeat protein
VKTRRGGDPPEYLEANIAMYERRFDDALVLVKKVRDRSPWRFEAITLEGEIQLLAANDLHHMAKLDEAIEWNRRAGDAYRAARAIARSSVLAIAGECQQSILSAQINAKKGISPEESAMHAVEACGDVHTVEPLNPEWVLFQSEAWSQIASYRAFHRGDADTAFDEAIRLAKAAMAIAPRSPSPYAQLAFVYGNLAYYRESRVQRREDVLELAIANAQHAIEVDPQYTEVFETLARDYEKKAQDEGERGIDPGASLASAMRWASKMAQQQPKGYRAPHLLGLIAGSAAQWKMAHGADPVEDFRQSVGYFEQVIARAPTINVGYAGACSITKPLVATRRASDAIRAPRWIRPLNTARRPPSSIPATISGRTTLDARTPIWHAGRPIMRRIRRARSSWPGGRCSRRSRSYRRR